MKITSEKLKEWPACQDGYRWFMEHFPAGEAEYQDVLNALADDDKPDYADWLMNRAGVDKETVLEIDEVTDRKHLFVAGSLIVKLGIRVSGCLCAGSGIKAGSGIEAGDGIKAGWGIEAGSDFAIFAGLRVKITLWKSHALVIAKTKPKNLMSGHWEQG